MDFYSTIKDAPAASREGAKVLKEFSAVVSKSGDAKTLTFQCSSGSVDRHGDRVIQAGLDTANFIKTGGPILWSYDYQALPLGRAVSLGMNAKGLTADILFADHPFAKQVYDLALGGFLRSVSIGFIAKEYTANSTGGYDYQSSELLSFANYSDADQGLKPVQMWSFGSSSCPYIMRDSNNRGQCGLRACAG